MGRLEKNIFANLGGVIWTAALGILSIPLYIKLMGIEAFGLVGLFLTLQSIFLIFDLGISTTLCREVARLATESDNIQRQRNFVFTLQVIHWLIASAIGATVFLIAPLIAHHWITPQSLSVIELTECVQLMGITMALQFPFIFYQGGLLGLHKQFLFNAISAFVVTLRLFVTLSVLHFISPAPKVFFASQATVAAVGTLLVALALWRCIPKSDGESARFRPELISRVWRFSATYAANSLASLGLFQMDKIILSKLLTLEMFGYYALAKGIVGGVYSLIVAVNSAIFPQFADLVARDDESKLNQIYHRGCQIMSVLIAPVAITTAIFSREALFVWTGDQTIVENSHIILTLLIVGMLLHGLTQPLFYLQVAYGWWRLISVTNLIVLPAIVPLYILMAQQFEGTGAASVLVFLNIIYILTLPLMYRRFLRGEQWRWIFEDVGLPLIGTLAIGSIAYWIFPTGLSRFEILGYLILVGILTTAVAALLASHIRSVVFVQLRAKTAALLD